MSERESLIEFLRRGPASNARSGARQMYVDRKFLRKCIEERAAKGEDVRKARRNLRFPRLSFHWIYFRKFGFRRWLLDGR